MLGMVLKVKVGKTELMACEGGGGELSELGAWGRSQQRCGR